MLKLVWRNLLAHPLRTLLTTGSVALAVFLLCFLQGTVTALTAVVDQASQRRLMVQSAVSLYINLPEAYRQRLEQVEGVDWVCNWQWFGGSFREDKSFAQFGISPETFAKSYPEIVVADGTYDAFQANRTGCLVGRDLANTYGWGVGDTIPLEGSIFRQNDGSSWEFDVEGIYESTAKNIDQNTIYFHYDYLREALETGAAQGPEGAGVYMLYLADGADATAIMATVDELYENGPQRVQTTTEAEFNKQFISMLGNVPLLLRAIGAAVLFAIFFAVLNTMLMAGRERTRDIGILKALGFSDLKVAGLLVIESLIVCLVGGGIGVGLAVASEASTARTFAGMIQGFEILPWIMGLGMGLAAAVGIVCGLAPARRALRLTPVTALRAEA